MMAIPRMMVFVVPVACAAALLTGCSGSTLLNAVIPHSGYSIKRDIAYGDNPRQRLDIYIPDGVKANAPVIVFFYGGSWQSGSKKDYRFVGQAFASKGYITVIADYRLYPEVRFPDFLTDAAHAFAWTHEHIGEYKGDPDKMFVSGHSAGGYIAVMLGTDSPYTSLFPKSWMKGVIGIAGAYDFLPFTDKYIKQIFSTEKDEKTQPIHWVKPGLPPMLLATGTKDTDVYPKNTLNMTRALQAQQNQVTQLIYKDVAHIGIVLSLADLFRYKATLLDDIDQFIKVTLDKK